MGFSGAVIGLPLLLTVNLEPQNLYWYPEVEGQELEDQGVFQSPGFRGSTSPPQETMVEPMQNAESIANNEVPIQKPQDVAWELSYQASQHVLARSQMFKSKACF